MDTKTVILTISLTVNFPLLGLVLILWFKKCKECGRDKEICKSFSKLCERCEKKDKEEKNGGQKPSYVKL